MKKLRKTLRHVAITFVTTLAPFATNVTAVTEVDRDADGRGDLPVDAPAEARVVRGKTRRSHLKAEWGPSIDRVEYWRGRGLDVAKSLGDFHEHWRKRGGMSGDWGAEFDGWCEEALRRLQATGARPVEDEGEEITGPERDALARADSLRTEREYRAYRGLPPMTAEEEEEY